MDPEAENPRRRFCCGKSYSARQYTRHRAEHRQQFVRDFELLDEDDGADFVPNPAPNAVPAPDEVQPAPNLQLGDALGGAMGEDEGQEDEGTLVHTSTVR